MFSGHKSEWILEKKTFATREGNSQWEVKIWKASPRFLVLQKQSENMLKTFLSWTKTDTDLDVVAVYQHLNDTKKEAAFSH